jgi:hypothetical protein
MPAIIPNSVKIFISVVDKTKNPTAVVRLVMRVINPIVLITFLKASVLSLKFQKSNDNN